MEGVGSRHGRSSTRYGPAIVFTGPVRKWKKRWVHVTPSSSSSSSNNASSNHQHQHQNQSQTVNGTIVNGNNGSHLLLYKWTPITQSQNTNGDKSSAKNDAVEDQSPSIATQEPPPKRRFKYIPVAVLEEQKNEDARNFEDESKPSDTEPNTAEPTSKSNGSDEKPDINDLPMEEQQVPNDNPLERQDLNESTLDLSLGLAHDGDHDSDMKTDQTKDG